MGNKVKEFVTYWGPSLNDWGDGTDKRFVIERDEDLLRKGAEGGATEGLCARINWTISLTGKLST